MQEITGRFIEQKASYNKIKSPLQKQTLTKLREQAEAKPELETEDKINKIGTSCTFSGEQQQERFSGNTAR